MMMMMLMMVMMMKKEGEEKKKKRRRRGEGEEKDLFKRCIFDALLFNLVCAKVPVHKSASSRSFFPLATNSHAQSMSPASCRSKRVDDRSRFYANFRDFRGARVSTLTPHVLKPNADPVSLT